MRFGLHGGDGGGGGKAEKPAEDLANKTDGAEDVRAKTDDVVLNVCA